MCCLKTRLSINRTNFQYNRPMPINKKNAKNLPIDLPVDQSVDLLLLKLRVVGLSVNITLS